MTPVPTHRVGPLHRALIEALESVAARDTARSLLRGALLAAQLEVVPEDADGFLRFTRTILAPSIERTLGGGIGEIVLEQLDHVVRMVAPAIRRQATGTGEDSDELSGERIVDVFGPASSKESGVGASRPRPEITAALRGPLGVAPLVAPTLFPPIQPPRTNAYESGTQQKRAAIARVSHPSFSLKDTRPDGVVQEVHVGRDDDARSRESAAPVSGPRAVATDVLVVTIDPRLVTEVETRMRGRSRVHAVLTLVDMMNALSSLAGQRIAIVLDTGVPSIDVPTFVTIALPENTSVILWGTDERQKKRLAGMFPQVGSWIASGATQSPADLLTDDQAR